MAKVLFGGDECDKCYFLFVWYLNTHHLPVAHTAKKLNAEKTRQTKFKAIKCIK